MTAPTPEPFPPGPGPVPPVPPLPPSPTPGCSGPGCLVPPLVQWQRRPTEAELGAAVAKEQARREQLLAAADPEQPPPVFGPLPTLQDVTVSRFGCGTHAIAIDLAALIHGPDCTAPDPTLLPGCNCTPEPPPETGPLHSEPLPLPDHWQ
ncbi:hypothetical protein ACIRH0_04220 [Streptomyces sp. NPDC093675]|uniref:hypothetical protein n=1 Tax=Streptomyces sp. NPDC093675 TaxID=3366049 RepID=UPI00381A4AB9